MPKRDWTPADESTIRTLHAQGKSLTHIAKQLGCTGGELSRHSKRLGLLWSGPKRGTAAATEAVRERIALQRAELAEQVLADAIAIRERIWDTYEVLVQTPVGPQRELLELPDAKAVAEFTTAVERLIKTHETLTRMGAGRDADHAKSMLMQMQDALRRAVEAEEQ